MVSRSIATILGLISLCSNIHLISCRLQIVPEPIELLQHEVDVLLCLSLVGDDGPEEVGQLAQRLVADHHAAGLHHATLEQETELSNRKENYDAKLLANSITAFVPGTR